MRIASAEHVAVLLGGGVQAETVHHPGEGHLNVKVILAYRALDILRRRLEFAFDDPAQRPERRWQTFLHAVS